MVEILMDNFVWIEGDFEAFDDLKREMNTTPILILSNFKRPFEVCMDASSKGIRAVLVKARRSLAFMSKVLGPM